MAGEGNGSSHIARALAEGARRSLDVQHPGDAPLQTAQSSPARIDLDTRLGRILDRHRWTLLGLLLLVLMEFVLFLSFSGSSRGN